MKRHHRILCWLGFHRWPADAGDVYTYSIIESYAACERGCGALT